MSDVLRVIACELQDRKVGTVGINRNRIEVNTTMTSTTIVLRDNSLYVFVEDQNHNAYECDPHIIDLTDPDAFDQLYSLVPPVSGI